MRIVRYRRAWIGILALSAGCAIGTFAAGPASATPVATHSCSGTSFTWTGQGDETSWSNANNWSPSGVPGACDSVDIPIEANITGGGQDDMTTGLDNTGTIKLASGILALTAGTYQQGAAGTLAVTFTGTSPGTGFGQLNVSGAVTLAGKLLVGTSGGFTPPTGTPFAVLRYTSRSGAFGTLAGSPAYTVQYHATGADVVFH